MKKNIRKICNTIVIATIVGHKSLYRKRIQLYTPIYGFNYNNQNYEVSNEYYSNIVKPIGKTVKLKINLNNPYQFIDNKSPNIILIVSGIIIFIFSLSIFIYMLTTYDFIKYI